MLGDSYDSLGLQLLGEVEAGASLLAAKVQPAKFKPYLSAVLKVGGAQRDALVGVCGLGGCVGVRKSVHVCEHAHANAVVTRLCKE
jgi:hypothetical protein